MRSGGRYIETPEGKLIPWPDNLPPAEAAKLVAPPEAKPVTKLSFGSKKVKE